MADKSPSKSMTLPPPTATTAPPPPPPSQSQSTPSSSTAPPPFDGTQSQTAPPLPVDVSDGPSSRDILIGGGVLVLLMVAFFFAKNAYATMLVARKVEPRSANAAGWWLFVFLSLVAVGVVLAAINRPLLTTLIVVIPLLLATLVSFVLMLMSGRR